MAAKCLFSGKPSKAHNRKKDCLIQLSGVTDSRFLQMVAPLLRTLVKLHAQHIMHRDIKPENIFLTGSQSFKLGDFGLAIQSNLELPYTRSGTLDYLSPEVKSICMSQEHTVRKLYVRECK